MESKRADGSPCLSAWHRQLSGGPRAAWVAAVIWTSPRSPATEPNIAAQVTAGRNGVAFDLNEEKVMSKKADDDAMPEALATFAKAARTQGREPAAQGVAATPETSGKPGDLEAEEKDAADILGGNATGDIKRVDAAIAHRAQTDKRAG
jgi:hypothetical protein